MSDAAQPNEGVRARTRLDGAREDERQAESRHDSASGPGEQLAAATDLHEAREQVAAREAWVAWVERDY